MWQAVVICAVSLSSCNQRSGQSCPRYHLIWETFEELFSHLTPAAHCVPLHSVGSHLQSHHAVSPESGLKAVWTLIWPLTFTRHTLGSSYIQLFYIKHVDKGSGLRRYILWFLILHTFSHIQLNAHHCPLAVRSCLSVNGRQTQWLGFDWVLSSNINNSRETKTKLQTMPLI